MGEVYRAKDTRLDRTVAIKVLPDELSANPEIRARFEREARAASSLNHPNICALYDVGHQDGVDFLVMEHLEGENLAARINRGALPTEELLRIAIQIADALDKAHRQGLIHRDLKPANVMLTKSGAKLLDFGLARATGLASNLTELSRSPTMSRPLTAEGHDRRDVSVHRARSARGRRGRRAERHLRVRRDALRDGDRKARVRGQEPGERDRRDPGAGAAADLDDPAARTARAGAAHPAVPRQGSRRAAPVDARCAARAEVDRRGRVEGRHPRRGRRAAARKRAARVGPRGRGHARGGGARGGELEQPPAPSRRPCDSRCRAPEGVVAIGTPKISPDGRLLAFDARDSSGVQQIWVRPLHAT